MAGDDRVEKKVGCRALFGPTSVRNSIPFVVFVLLLLLWFDARSIESMFNRPSAVCIM